jgi:predicted CoA-binding protein
MNDDDIIDDNIMDDDRLAEILRSTRTIAMVGASPSPDRDSHDVMRYLQDAGYRVIPVNPTAAGQAIHGEPVMASLAEIDEPFELVDVFRRRDAVPDVVAALLPLVDTRGIRTLWLQLGVGHPQAASRARAAGLTVVAERCLKIEHRRLTRAGDRLTLATPG